MSVETDRIISTYRPIHFSDRWPTTCTWVRATVSAAGPATPGGALQWMMAVTGYAAWLLGQGMPLDLEAVFTPQAIEHYVAVGLRHLSPTSRGTKRSYLSTIGRRVTKAAPWEPKQVHLPRRQLAAPYTAEQVDRMWECALAQATPRRRRTGAALVTLGLGAGLAASEYQLITGDSVSSDDGLVWLTVGGQWPRRLPVIARYAGVLVELAERCGSRPLAADPMPTHRNALNSLAKLVEVPRTVGSVSVSRMRTTWMVRMLAAGVPMKSFFTMYGPITTRISDLLPYLPEPTTAELAAHIARVS